MSFDESPALNKPARDLIQDIIRQTTLPTIQLKTVRRETSRYASKFGGIPYLPPGFSYPLDTRPFRPYRSFFDRLLKKVNHLPSNNPLKLLAQLNFAELPNIPGFPDHGILQFYISNGRKFSLWGVNYDLPTDQSGFRAIYHENICEDESKLQLPPPNIPSEDFPFQGEFALEAQLTTMPVTLSDFRFDGILRQAMMQQPQQNHAELEENEDQIADYYSDEIDPNPEGNWNGGHRIGGYPRFTQDDPRDRKLLSGYTTLLLQIDSDEKIMWGDAGVANFFIKPEALSRCDFSDVLYNWDCS